MLYNVYEKDIATNTVKPLKEIEVTKAAYESPKALAIAIADKVAGCGWNTNTKHLIETVATLNTGKLDICFEVSGISGKRYMCYAIGDVTVTTKVSMRRVCDMLISAFEGGSTYWAQSAYYWNEAALEKGAIWYNMPELMRGAPKSGVIFTLHYDSPELHEGNGKGKTVVTRSMLATGLNKMAKEAPRHYADIVSENDDAITADVFLQYIVLGDIIYG